MQEDWLERSICDFFKAIHRVCYAFMKNAQDALREDYKRTSFCESNILSHFRFEIRVTDSIMALNHRYEYLQG